MPSEEINRALERGAPALLEALSPLGRRAVFPRDIPFQAAEARGRRFNATIGQITDGAGGALALPALDRALVGLSPEDRSRALLYSPIGGIQELRERWRRWQRRGLEEEVVSGLPVVTAGLTHGLSLIADLFAGGGRAVAVAAPFWGNYRQIFGLRTGAHIVSAPAYEGGRFRAEAVGEALARQPRGPALALLNFPSNPGGYAPTAAERETLCRTLVEAARKRPVLAICDDAYAGLVYEPAIPAGSLFWELAGRHPNLVPVKVDGATKEFSLFGGRVGFLTFPFAPDSAVSEALDSKLRCLSRAAIGSPVATSQMLLLQALREDTVESDLATLRRLLAERWRALREALEAVDRALLRPLPCNAGCFALLELASGVAVSAEAVRRHLLATQDVGLVALGERHLRIAFCSVDAAALPELVRRIEAGIRSLAGRGSKG